MPPKQFRSAADLFNYKAGFASSAGNVAIGDGSSTNNAPDYENLAVEHLLLEERVSTLEQSLTTSIAEVQAKMASTKSYSVIHRQRLEAGVIAGSLGLAGLFVALGFMQSDWVFTTLGVAVAAGTLAHATNR